MDEPKVQIDSDVEAPTKSEWKATALKYSFFLAVSISIALLTLVYNANKNDRYQWDETGVIARKLNYDGGYYVQLKSGVKDYLYDIGGTATPRAGDEVYRTCEMKENGRIVCGSLKYMDANVYYGIDKALQKRIEWRQKSLIIRANYTPRELHFKERYDALN
tara:strand:- start:231546 stop:232031 length:486 start_codon:yes stop_codon:yes gene_type:complete